MEMGWRWDGDGMEMGWRWDGDGMEMGWRWGGDGMEIGMEMGWGVLKVRVSVAVEVSCGKSIWSTCTPCAAPAAALLNQLAVATPAVSRVVAW